MTLPNKRPQYQVLLAHGCYQLTCLVPQAELTDEIVSLLKQTYKICKKKLLTQMCRYQCKALRIMKNQVDMTPPKDSG